MFSANAARLIRQRPTQHLSWSLLRVNFFLFNYVLTHLKNFPLWASYVFFYDCECEKPCKNVCNEKSQFCPLQNLFYLMISYFFWKFCWSFSCETTIFPEHRTVYMYMYMYNKIWPSRNHVLYMLNNYKKQSKSFFPRCVKINSQIFQSHAKLVYQKYRNCIQKETNFFCTSLYV